MAATVEPHTLTRAVDTLRSFFGDWISGAVRELEKAAALKDLLSLIQLAPKIFFFFLPGLGRTSRAQHKARSN